MRDDLMDQFALIEGFTKDQIKIFRPLIEDVRYETDQIIFEQGDRADYLYFVLEGKVSIQFNPDDGPVLCVSEVDQGGVFGWSAALGSEHYTSSAICEEGGIFVRMEGEKLKNLCQEHPETGILLLDRLAGVIAQRLKGTHEKVVELLNRGLNHS
jgi:CRP-like cAMP-binding protein